MANLFYEQKTVTIGDKFCHCYLCEKDIQAKNRDDYDNQMNKLIGKLEGKPILVLNKRGEKICICKKHIEEIYNQILELDKQINKYYKDDEDGQDTK